MLYVPPSARTCTICGIDPGTNTLGCALLEVDIDTLAVHSIYTHTYVGEMLPHSESLEIGYGDRLARLDALKQSLWSIFEASRPLYIGCEAPFINPRRPMAYGALVEAVGAVQAAVIAYNVRTVFRLVPPSLVKKAVQAKSNDKDAVWEGMLRIPEIVVALNGFRPDEHSVDAIAVAYYVLQQIRTNPTY